MTDVRIGFQVAIILVAVLVNGSKCLAEATGERLPTLPPATQPLVLTAQIEYAEVPQLDRFKKMVLGDPSLPCEIKCNLRRLLQVALDRQQRRIVWRRMRSQELYWVRGKALAQVEEYARACEMPL